MQAEREVERVTGEVQAARQVDAGGRGLDRAPCQRQQAIGDGAGRVQPRERRGAPAQRVRHARLHSRSARRRTDSTCPASNPDNAPSRTALPPRPCSCRQHRRRAVAAGRQIQRPAPPSRRSRQCSEPNTGTVQHRTGHGGLWHGSRGVPSCPPRRRRAACRRRDGPWRRPGAARRRTGAMRADAALPMRGRPPQQMRRAHRHRRIQRRSASKGSGSLDRSDGQRHRQRVDVERAGDARLPRAGQGQRQLPRAAQRAGGEREPGQRTCPGAASTAPRSESDPSPSHPATPVQPSDAKNRGAPGWWNETDPAQCRAGRSARPSAARAHPPLRAGRPWPRRRAGRTPTRPASRRRAAAAGRAARQAADCRPARPRRSTRPPACHP